MVRFTNEGRPCRLAPFYIFWECCVVAGAMTIPLAVDYVYGYEDWSAFMAASAITLFFGFGLLLSAFAP